MASPTTLGRCPIRSSSSESLSQWSDFSFLTALSPGRHCWLGFIQRFWREILAITGCPSLLTLGLWAPQVHSVSYLLFPICFISQFVIVSSGDTYLAYGNCCGFTYYSLFYCFSGIWLTKSKYLYVVVDFECKVLVYYFRVSIYRYR